MFMEARVSEIAYHLVKGVETKRLAKGRVKVAVVIFSLFLILWRF